MRSLPRFALDIMICWIIIIYNLIEQDTHRLTSAQTDRLPSF